MPGGSGGYPQINVFSDEYEEFLKSLEFLPVDLAPAIEQISYCFQDLRKKYPILHLIYNIETKDDFTKITAKMPQIKSTNTLTEVTIDHQTLGVQIKGYGGTGKRFSDLMDPANRQKLLDESVLFIRKGLSEIAEDVAQMLENRQALAAELHTAQLNQAQPVIGLYLS